jgi:starch synthase
VSIESSEAFVRSLADAMVTLAEDPAARMAMGAAARQRVAEHYDWDVLVDRLLTIYADIA